MYNPPLYWVPSLYFAMGLPFVVLNMVAAVMYKDLGVTDAQIAFWTSLIMWPWTIKFLWSPLLELYGSKKFWVVSTQFLSGVLFPRKIGGRYAMLSRPSDKGHTPFGDIYYSESPDLEFWGRHRLVMRSSEFRDSAWQCTKVGAGPVPIETSEGWLLIYHGVHATCNGFNYSFGAALLDLDEPWKVIARTGAYLLAPREIYECTGDVPNVVFPCATLHDPATGRLAVYYGCADTVVGVAFGYIPEIIEFTKKTNIL